MNQITGQKIYPLMPKATAKWLIENTSLTFLQIAEFCGLDELAVKGIADDEVAVGIRSLDPILNHQLTEAEIKRCEQDSKAKLEISAKAANFTLEEKKLKKRYTPIAKRQDKPNAIAWLLKNCPDINDAQIVKLIGTTKTTIEAIRNKTHWNYINIKAKDPVLLGLCTQADLDLIIEMTKKNNEIIE